MVVGCLAICNFEGLVLDFLGSAMGIQVDSNNKLEYTTDAGAAGEEINAWKKFIRKSSSHGEL